MKIESFALHRLHLPLREPIGDSQVRFEDHWMTVLELHTDDGQTGVGFDIQQGMPIASLADLTTQFEYGVWPAIEGHEPLGLANRITRPRGGNVGGGHLSKLYVETALWDLVGKQVGRPLYQVLGGTDPRVPAYGSTLDFHLSDDDFRQKLERFVSLGFDSIKVKIGHPDVAWDLRRLAIVKEVMGMPKRLMVDANEAWSFKEALMRLNRYRDEGCDIFWIEDPITREDYEGYAKLCAELAFTQVNTGEYLGFHGKRRLLECGGVDVMNLHGSVSMTRAAAYLAGDYGVPVAIGNTILELGVHLAASLPECQCLEFSDLVWNELAVEPVKFQDGYAIAPDRPGHGLELDRDKLAFYAEP